MLNCYVYGDGEGLGGTTSITTFLKVVLEENIFLFGFSDFEI